MDDRHAGSRVSEPRDGARRARHAEPGGPRSRSGRLRALARSARSARSAGATTAGTSSLGLREQAWGTKWKGFLALHTDDSGALDGYVRYRTEEKWEHNVPRGTATVDELIALTPEAYAALWQYLASMDLVVTVKAEGRSPSERLPWLLADARAANQADAGMPCGCASSTCRPRWAPASTSVKWTRSRDRRSGGAVGTCPGPTAGGPDGAAARPTSDSPDLTLDVAALGAAYLGGSRASRRGPGVRLRRARRGCAAPGRRVLPHGAKSRGVRRSSDAGEAGAPGSWERDRTAAGEHPALPEFRALLAARGFATRWA